MTAAAAAGPSRALTRLCAALSRACLQLAALGLIGVILCVQVQVVGRYGFNDTPTWTEAVALLLVLYVTALGVAVGVRDAGHIGLESVAAWLPPAWQRPLAMAVHACVALFGALMLHSGWRWTALKWPQAKPMLGVSEGLDFLPLTVSGALIVLFSIEHMVALRRGEEVRPAWP